MKNSLLLIVLFLFLVAAKESQEDWDAITSSDDCRQKGGTWDLKTKICSKYTTPKPPSNEESTSETKTSLTAPTTTATKKEEPVNNRGSTPNGGRIQNDCPDDQIRDEIRGCITKEIEKKSSDETIESTTSGSQTTTTTKAIVSDDEQLTTMSRAISTETGTTIGTEVTLDIAKPSKISTSTSGGQQDAFSSNGALSFISQDVNPISLIESLISGSSATVSTTTSGSTTSSSKSTSFDTTKTSPGSYIDETENDSSEVFTTTPKADVTSTTTAITTSPMEFARSETIVTEEDFTTIVDSTIDSSTTSSTIQSTTSESTTSLADVTSTTTVISTFLMETTHLGTTIIDEESTITDDTTEINKSTSMSTTKSTLEDSASNTTISLSDNSTETATTPLEKEIWDLDPGEYPMEGMTIFLCPSATTTTKLPTSSFTIIPSSDKVTSVETGFTYSPSQGPVSTSALESSSTSELSSGGTKPAEGTMSTTSTPTSESSSEETSTSGNHGHGSTTTVLSTVTTSTTDRTSYGTSSSVVSSTSSASSRAQNGLSSSTSTITSSDSGTDTTASNAKETLSTETTGMRTSTAVETTAEPPTTFGTTLPTSSVWTSGSSSDSTTSVTPHSSVPSSSASISSTEHVMTSTTIASPSPTYSSQSTTSKTGMSSVSPSSSYSKTIDLEMSPSTGETSTFGNDETKQSTSMPQVATISQETYGTSDRQKEITTIGMKSSSEGFTTSMEKETSLPSTGSNLPDTKSTTSPSYSNVSLSTTTQKTTTTVVSKEENSSSAIVSSTESTATTVHENVESSAPTQISMEENTENTGTSTTEMSPSSPIEVTDNTESSNSQTKLKSVSSSSNEVFSSSTVSEVQYPTTSLDETEKATPDVKTSTLFRSETTEEETTDFSSSLSTVTHNVESTTKASSTSGRSSKPTSSGLETSQESVETTTTEDMSSDSTPSKGIYAPASSVAFSNFTSPKTNGASSSKTTTGVLKTSITTVQQDEFTQGTSSTTSEIETEAATIRTESSPKKTSVPRTNTPSRNPDVETISSSSSKPTTGTVITTTSVAHTNVESTSATPSEQTDSSSAGPTTLSSTLTLSSETDVITPTQQSPTSLVDSSSNIPLAKSTFAKMESTTTGTLKTSGTKSSTVSNAKMTTSPKTTKNISAAPPLPPQSEKSSSSFSTSKKVTPSGTPPSSAPSTSRQSTPSTTQDPLCKQQCPQGYLVGTSLCFQLVPASSKINSYQSALSYCKTTDRQTLASLDKIRDNSDIKIIQESAGLQNIDWIYANGIGSKQERFQKTASVYSIFSQSLVSSPILKNVGISEVFGNVSALCVLPQYCNSTECDVEKLFLAYEYYNAFKQTAGTLQPKQQGDVTCLYGNQKSTKVTCNSLGAIYPNPTNIDCEESAAERKIIDTTNQTVSSCKECFGRGTRECQEVLGENGNVEGYRCVCQEPFTMASCWRTENPCNSSYCGENGKCVSELGDVSCECDWGFTGDKCETQLAKKFDGDFGYSSAVGATITLGGILLRVLKVALMGFTLSNEQGDDPQDTHQRLRTYLMTGAGVIMCFYSNPTLLAISPSACRFYYVAIHFCYMMAMLQWLFEGWNVNQVLRCVHLNEWEIDWQGKRSWGVRIAPRMILSFLLTGTFLLITFQTGWNKLAASWTCVGVICQETLNIWIPVFSAVLIIVLFGGTVYESSIMIKYRRPLLGYKIDMKIERELGREVGRRVQKCRENDSLSIIGLLLLVAQYISVIYSSDKRDEPLYGYVTVVLSGIYSTFCSYQEIITCPEDRADFYKRLQRWFPVRFAPDYNPETMWTLPEVKEFYSVPKAEREARYENFLSRNEKLYIHHRWDVRINQIFLENKEEFKINDALVQIWHEEMRDLKSKNGTKAQKYVIQGVYADYMDTVPDKDPRDAGKLKGRLELVTLAAEDDKNGVRLAKFFIVPTFHTFTPEMPDSSHTPQNEIIRDHERRLMAQLDTDIYELTREASEEQKTFVNSAIVFWNYGNKVVR